MGQMVTATALAHLSYVSCSTTRPSVMSCIPRELEQNLGKSGWWLTAGTGLQGETASTPTQPWAAPLLGVWSQRVADIIPQEAFAFFFFPVSIGNFSSWSLHWEPGKLQCCEQFRHEDLSPYKRTVVFSLPYLLVCGSSDMNKSLIQIDQY